MALHVNKPNEWSNQDLGWSIPIFNIPATQAGMDRVLQRVVDSGSKLIITDFDWPSFQPSNPANKTAGNNDNGGLAGNAFGSVKHDLLMDRCTHFGIYVVAGCQYTPNWANGNANNDKVPPSRDKTNYADYCNFVWNVVDRYQIRNPDRLIAVSIWNEPNISEFWKDPNNGNGPYVVNYSKMLIAAYDTVKTGVVKAAGGNRARSAHPEIMVGNGGMSPALGNGNNGGSYGWPQWVNGLIANGATNKFDLFFVHPYMWICPGTEMETWNPLTYIQPCYTALRNAGRTNVYAWATEIGGGTRKDDSGTDPGSFNCAQGGPAGGYNSGAPSGKYNTNSAAVDYTTARNRATTDIAEWRSAHFYDSAPAVNRQWSGPLFVWTLNDTAQPTDWAGANKEWQPHAGCYERGPGDGTTGPAKPHAATWIAAFTNTGGPKISGPVDTTKPDTHIQTIAGVDITVPVAGAAAYPIGLATGAGIPSNEEMNAAKAFGAKFVRCGIPWDSGSSGPSAAFDKPNAITNAIAYANSIGLDVLLQIGSGTTHGGHMYSYNANGVNVVTTFAAYASNVIRAFTGVKHANGTRDSNYVMAIEVLNEANHAKINDPADPFFVAWVTAPSRYAEIFLRIVHADWNNVRATANCPPIITTGLGGERDTKGITSFDFTVAVHQTVTFGAHTYTGGLWPTAAGAVPWYSGYDLHPYCYPTLPSQDTTDGWDNMKKIMAWFQANRGKKPPLYITEIGHPTNPETLANCLAARNTLQDGINDLDSLIANAGWDIRCFAWFSMMNNNKPPDPNKPNANDNFFGIVDRPGTGTDPQQGTHKPGPPLVPAGKGEYFNKFKELATRTSGGGSGFPTPTVSGSAVALTVFANDNIAIARVDVLVDGVVVGQASPGQSGYGYILDSTKLTNGAHQLQSRATDTSSNVTTSTVANFTSQNTGGGPNLPTVTSVSPNAVPTAGGTVVTLQGANLSSVTLVQVGTTAGGWTACTGLTTNTWFPLDVGHVDLTLTSIQITVPAHAAGTVHVRATNPAGVSALINADRITYVTGQTVGAPILSRVAPPAFGPLGGGGHITLEGGTFTAATGVWFYPSAGGARVAASSFVITADTGIDVVVPALAAGIYDVRVENAIGLSAVIPEDAYLSTSTPVVSLTGVNDGDTIGGIVAVVVEAVVSSSSGYGLGPYGAGPYGGSNNPTVRLVIDEVTSSLLPIRVDSGGNPDEAGTFYQFALNTAQLTEIEHTIRATATDEFGTVGSSPLLTVTVDNAGSGIPDIHPPTVQILSPSTGGRVSGTQAAFAILVVDDVDPIVPTVELWITATVNTPPPPTDRAFELGTSYLGGPDALGGGTGAVVPGGRGWGSGPWGSGPWGGGAGSSPVSFIDPSPFAALPAGTTVDPIRLIGVGVPDATGVTFIVLWDTTTVAEGVYQLQAKAVDSSANEAWSAAIFITVQQDVIIPVHPGAPDARYPWRVYVRDGVTLERVAVVVGFHSLDATLRFNDVGVFTLIVPSTDTALPYLVAPLAGILVFYRDQVVFSGDITEGHESWDQNDMWEFVGEDDNAFIRNALLHGSPAEEPPTDTGRYIHSVDIESGPAESLILHYMAVNFGPNAIPNRVVPQIAMAVDQGRGTTLKTTAGFGLLLPQLQSIAASSTPALGFRVAQVPGAHPPLRAEVYVPIDKSTIVRFAAQLGNLMAYTLDYVAPTANVVYAAGDGDGTARKFVVRENTASIARWRRRETLTDHVDAETLEELAVAAGADVVELNVPDSISLEPKDHVNARFVDDYFLGDKVMAILPDGTELADVVVEVAIRLDSTGVLVKPALGASPRDAFAVFTETRRLSQAVRTLQTTTTRQVDRT